MTAYQAGPANETNASPPGSLAGFFDRDARQGENLRMTIRFVPPEPLMKSTKQLRHERRQIYQQAMEFQRVSEILSRQSMDDRTKQERLPLFASIVVNSALALELYLKLLLHIETGSYPFRHELMSVLFRRLTRSHKIRIKSLYDAAWSQNWKNNPGNPLSPRQFRDAMQHSDKAFVKWRYIFQSPRRRLRYSGTLIIPHVKTVIFEEAPELQPISH